jgi:ligand-binding SRPBCC domain-containing protein
VLKKLTPFPIIFQFKYVEPVGEGTKTIFNLWFGSIRVPWKATHHDFQPQSGFTDTQNKGSFSSWVHKHSFNNIDSNTSEVIDEIEAQFGQGFFSGLVSRFMWLTLPILFNYRSWQTRRLVKGWKNSSPCNDLQPSQEATKFG